MPQDIRDQLIAENFGAMGDAGKSKGSQHTKDALHDAFVGEATASSAPSETLSSPSRKRTRMMEDTEDTHDVSVPMQTTLPSRVNSQSWVKERQRVAEMEIARTLIECNISLNVLRTDQWKRMVRAIAQVGNTESWSGLDYKKMCTRALYEQKALKDKALVPVKSR